MCAARLAEASPVESVGGVAQQRIARLAGGEVVREVTPGRQKVRECLGR